MFKDYTLRNKTLGIIKLSSGWKYTVLWDFKKEVIKELEQK